MLTAVRVEEPTPGCSMPTHVAALKFAVLNVPVAKIPGPKTSGLKDRESPNRQDREAVEPSNRRTQNPEHLVESGAHVDVAVGKRRAVMQDPLGGCFSLDTNRDATVDISELIGAVGCALENCP